MKIHLIGIGGTGMGALAGLLVAAGHEVRGSDGPLYPPMSTLLDELAIVRAEGFRAENLSWSPDRVVVGNICRRDHPEALAAREQGLPLISFPALLAELFLEQRHPIVVAGTHGKTTTSSLAAHILHHAGLAPGFLVGGIPLNFARSYALGQPPYFVIEGDEYDTAFFDKRPKFVHYRPQTVLLTGVEFDHVDIYPTFDHVQQAFSMLVERVPAQGRIVVCNDADVAPHLSRQGGASVETYSLHKPADWTGQRIGQEKERQLLEVHFRGEAVGQFSVPLSGEHNLANALAVVAMASGLGVTPESIAAGLASFQGVKRRQEVRGRVSGVTVIDDFAHHPTAIQLTLAGLRGIHGAGRLIAVFEPRSATSRRNIFQQKFVEALALADEVVLPPLYQPENIASAERLDPRRIVEDLKQRGIVAQQFENVPAIVQYLSRSCRGGDTVVVMSSGSFGGLIDALLVALEQRG